MRSKNKSTSQFIVEEEEDDDLGIVKDPVLAADVYFGRPHNGREALPMCDTIAKINTAVPQLMFLDQDPCMYTNRYLTQDIFNRLLTLYENNQMIYSDTLDTQETVTALNNLEAWFIQVVEPVPTTREKDDRIEWCKREKNKVKGHSGYCDEDCAKKIRVSKEVMEQVARNWTCLVTDYKIK